MQNKLKINYHIFEACNMKCKFCFRDKTNNLNTSINYKNIIRLIKENDTRNKINCINLAGGEISLYKDLEGLVDECNKNFESTTIITNGFNFINDKNLFLKIVKKIDVFGLSIDSLNDKINTKIGRHVSKKFITYEDIQYINNICKQNKVKFKINIVVNSLNLCDKSLYIISKLNIDRIKLLMNQSSNLKITKDEFFDFCKSFKENVKCHDIVIEQNMTDSYFMITSDEIFSINKEKYNLKDNTQIFNEKIDWLLNNQSYSNRYNK